MTSVFKETSTWEEVPLYEDVPCLDPNAKYTTNYREGWHCENFHGFYHNPEGRLRHCCLKKGVFPCSFEDIERLNMEHREIREKLGDMVPSAVFVQTMVNNEGENEEGVLVIADPIDIKMDIFSESRRDEVISIFKTNEKAKEQAERFLEVSEVWEGGGKVIDLYGEENLVLLEGGKVAFVDSFDVFLDPQNPDHEEFISISRRNTQTLRDILIEAEKL